MKTVIIQRSQQIADRQWQRLKTVRAELLARPYTTRWGVFQFDDAARGVMQDVLAGFSAGHVQWTAADNQRVALTAQELGALFRDLVQLRAQRQLDVHAYSMDLRARLPLAPDHPALRGEGWPG